MMHGNSNMKSQRENLDSVIKQQAKTCFTKTRKIALKLMIAGFREVIYMKKNIVYQGVIQREEYTLGMYAILSNIVKKQGNVHDKRPMI
jgi:hypothetical protein